MTVEIGKVKLDFDTSELRELRDIIDRLISAFEKLSSEDYFRVGDDKVDTP